MAEWYYGIDGAHQGPVDEAALKMLVQSGEITEKHLVWKEGMKDWVLAKDIDELFPKAEPSPATKPRRTGVKNTSATACGKVFTG